MAKYNMMLGVAAGSVGDIVLSRQNGKQIQRVRVREVANPKTEGQAAQRSFVAPVTKFYSPFAIALERSWEGMNKGQSYSAYLKYNTQLARDRQWALPKGTGFFPLPFRVSKGTLPTLPQSLAVTDGMGTLDIVGGKTFVGLGEKTVGMFSRSLIAAGYHVHDQITILIVTQNDYDNIYAAGCFVPSYIRFYLDPTSTKPLSDYGFSATAGSDGNVWTFAWSNVSAACIIVSRYERGVWRRTTQDLLVDNCIINTIESATERAANINTYRPVTDSNPSDIYLNGSDAEFAMLLVPTRAGGTVGIVGIDRIGEYAMAVAEDGTKWYIYNNNKQSLAYARYLQSDGTWVENADLATENAVCPVFEPNGDNAQQNLEFFMAYGFTYADLLGY